MEQPFMQPPVEIGDLVWWFTGSRHSRPAPAFVTRANEGNVDLILFPPGQSPYVATTVQHCDDPDIRHPDTKGMWDFTDQAKADAAWRAAVNQKLGTKEELPATKTALVRQVVRDNPGKGKAALLALLKEKHPDQEFSDSLVRYALNTV